MQNSHLHLVFNKNIVSSGSVECENIQLPSPESKGLYFFFFFSGIRLYTELHLYIALGFGGLGLYILIGVVAIVVIVFIGVCIGFLLAKRAAAASAAPARTSNYGDVQMVNNKSDYGTYLFSCFLIINSFCAV